MELRLRNRRRVETPANGDEFCGKVEIRESAQTWTIVLQQVTSSVVTLRAPANG
jgi:hypothetical protein